MKKARGEMQKTVGALDNFMPGKAAAAEDKALYYLKKSREGLGSFNYVPGGSSGRGEMPSMMPAGSSGQLPGSSGSSGSRGFRQSSFEIPRGRHKQFDEFMKDLSNARKSPKPEKYREMLKDYYDSLSR